MGEAAGLCCDLYTDILPRMDHGLTKHPVAQSLHSQSIKLLRTSGAGCEGSASVVNFCCYVHMEGIRR